MTTLPAQVARVALAAAVVLVMQAAPSTAQDHFVDPDQVDELFFDLMTASSKEAADGITDRIQQVWLSPSDPQLRRLITEAVSAQRTRHLPRALAVLNHIVETYPDYAEGWNQRATLYYSLGNLENSLADIEKVLAIEPRHFGALSGQAAIYRLQGREQEALQTIMEALRYHPFLDARTMFPQLHEPLVHL